MKLYNVRHIPTEVFDLLCLMLRYSEKTFSVYKDGYVRICEITSLKSVNHITNQPYEEICLAEY